MNWSLYKDTILIVLELYRAKLFQIECVIYETLVLYRDEFYIFANMDRKWYGENFKFGVLGGGQLGRMLIQAAMNYDVRIYAMDKSKDAPCGSLAYEFTEGDITDFNDVIKFGSDKDVITVEIENVNVDALEQLENQGKKVFPQPHVLRLIQDKGLQKQFYIDHNIPTAPFKWIDDLEAFKREPLTFPFIQKLRTGGYDGKGVQKIEQLNDLENGFKAPSIAEEMIDFEKELSVIAARNEKGETITYPLVECEFSPELNLVEFLFSPADVTKNIENEAEKLAITIIEALDMVGLLAVELFLTKEGKLLVNEVAPRTHNSGHHTIECNETCQFEQHLRAVLNLPLGSTETVTPGVMVNLLGAPSFKGPAVYEALEEVMTKKGIHVHLYGKAHTKPHRKMGHATIASDSLEQAKQTARWVQKTIKIRS
jgi:5-(carboxyamino)imidazole ribonucleotide synthase